MTFPNELAYNYFCDMMLLHFSSIVTVSGMAGPEKK